MIKDSGNRRAFSTGAVRDMQEGKGRCDLMPLNVLAEWTNSNVLAALSRFQRSNSVECLASAYRSFLFESKIDANTALLELAKHFEEGAKKYGECNWQKGIPVNCYIDSAVRHYLKWRRGDNDERHDRAFIWNICCCAWEVKRGEKK